MPGKLLLAASPVAPGLACPTRGAEMAAETVEQLTMRAWIDQRTLDMPAMALAKRAPDDAQPGATLGRPLPDENDHRAGTRGRAPRRARGPTHGVNRAP